MQEKLFQDLGAFISDKGKTILSALALSIRIVRAFKSMSEVIQVAQLGSRKQL
jgi:hypothetical protein